MVIISSSNSGVYECFKMLSFGTMYFFSCRILVAPDVFLTSVCTAICRYRVGMYLLPSRPYTAICPDNGVQCILIILRFLHGFLQTAQTWASSGVVIHVGWPLRRDQHISVYIYFYMLGLRWFTCKQPNLC